MPHGVDLACDLRDAAVMKAFATALVALLVLTAASPGQAALPPEAYEQLRSLAPMAFVGMVQQDTGGRAQVRVDHVARGPLGVGQLVTVVYPVATGYAAPGPQVHYRPFTPGTRLRVFGQPGYDGRTVRIVHGGIDIMAPPTQPKTGCASCAVGGDPRPLNAWRWLLAAAGLGVLRRRRTGTSPLTLAWAGWIVAAAVSCAPASPSPPVPGPVAPPVAATGNDGVEIASDGKSSVTVLNRPDHPSVKPAAGDPQRPRTNAECRMQQTCATSGLCTAAGTACVAASYADCAQMRGCGHGKCAFAAGACSVVPSCTQSHGCRTEGTCVDRAEGCTADADGCSKSAICQKDGRCSVDGGICVAVADADCKDATVCAEGGRCTVDAGRCVAKDDNACKRAPACKNEGRCLARDGQCVKSCAEGELCKRNGRCGERPKHPGSCVALSDADCDKSEVCKELGHCSLGLNARCEAGDDVECRLSQTCKEDGRCTHKLGRCVPASDAECSAASIACQREGRCKHVNGQCVKG